MAFVDLSGCNNLIKKLDKLEHIDATTLMFGFEKLIEEDNRKGVMAGLGKDSQPLLPVSYRPRREVVDIRGKSADAKRMRNNAKGNAKKGKFSGFGPWASGLHNNLSYEEYLQLTGPPLAPRGYASRVITNLVTSFLVDPTRRIWTAVGAWKDVVNVKGIPFLRFLFPKRDIRGVRPAGMAKAKVMATNWLRDYIRTHVTK